METVQAPAQLAVSGAIATITLDNPGVLNALDPAMARELQRLAALVESMAAVRVLVIRGAGPAFCAGGDIRTFAENADTIGPFIRELLFNYHEFLLCLRRMPKLVLISVHGAAAGAGFSLVTMGDLCIAADDARFVPAYARLGVSPDGGGTLGAVRTVGVRRAMQIFLAEDAISAAQAEAWGLVNKVVPAAALVAETAALAERLARNEPAAIAATKRLLHQAPTTSAEAQLAAEIDALVGCMERPDFRGRVESFLRGRPR